MLALVVIVAVITIIMAVDLASQMGRRAATRTHPAIPVVVVGEEDILHTLTLAIRAVAVEDTPRILEVTPVEVDRAVVGIQVVVEAHRAKGTRPFDALYRSF